MTDDEIIEIRDSMLPSQGEQFDMLAFGREIAAAEREACAKVCDAAEDTGNAIGIERDVFFWNKATKYCATAIRKRSNAQGKQPATTNATRDENNG